MAIWIDPPAWPAHDRLWSHLISDTTVVELHDFAARQGIPRRGFEGDHYDVPQERYADLVAAGAQETTSRDLLRRLQVGGLRLRKRRGEKGVARVLGVEFPDGSSADVDLVRAPTEAPEGVVFAAILLVTAGDGRVAACFSPRRQEWSIPGGWREEGESVRACAVRELEEETGLVVPEQDLRPVGYERFHPVSLTGLWPSGGGIIQMYRVAMRSAPTELVAAEPDSVDPQWMTLTELESRSGDRFWWPLLDDVVNGAASAHG